MLKKIIGYLFLFFPLTGLQAQDSVQNRLILIGDAGEINPHQSEVLTTAAGKILDQRTTVLFLGDNIYPNGMPLKDTAAMSAAEKILSAQYEPMLQKGAKVIFVPGNHDWDRMGKQGYQKILAQDAFLNGQNNPNLRLLPEKGCPGPEEISISENTVLIAFDSEWWLFQHEKNSEERLQHKGRVPGKAFRNCKPQSRQTDLSGLPSPVSKLWCARRILQPEGPYIPAD